MRPFFELQPLAAIDANDIRHHHSWTDMAIPLLHFTDFFQGEEIFSYADWEIDGFVHASRRERDVTFETYVVFLVAFSLQPLTEKLHNKRPNSLRE